MLGRSLLYVQSRRAIHSNKNSFYFVERKFIIPAIIELSCSRRRMIGHRRRALDSASILQIGCDASGPECVVAYLGRNPSSSCAPADHCIGIGLGQGSCSQLFTAAADGAKQIGLWVIPEIEPIDVAPEIPQDYDGRASHAACHLFHASEPKAGSAAHANR
jgi:ferredoxin